jgi:hypothetical protein
MVSNLLHLLWTRHRLNIATITVSLLVILLISTLSVSVAVGEESISLNVCTIGGGGLLREAGTLQNVEVRVG